MEKQFQQALILGGGGQFGIAWELGYIRGLQDEGISLRNSDMIVGTSAGSQVGSLLASDKSWEALWEEQVLSDIHEESPADSKTMMNLFTQFDAIADNASDSFSWVQGMANLAINTATKFDEEKHISQIKNRVGQISWGNALHIVATSATTSQRQMWNVNDRVDVYHAMSASSSLPGVWPVTTVGDDKYFDGGSYSVENADVAKDAAKAIIFATGLPIKTPETLDDQLQILDSSNTSYQVIKPDNSVMDIFAKYGNNSVDPSLRKDIATVARQQGQNEAARLKAFL